MSQSPKKSKKSSLVVIKDLDAYGFSKVITEVLLGKKLARKSWPANEFVFLNEGFLRISREGVVFNWTVSREDMEATDYKVLEG